MTDEELERRLRQWRVSGPAADVRRRVLAAPPPRPDRFDFMVGWVIAMIAAAWLCASAWLAERTLRDRIETIPVESDIAAQMHEAEALLGPQGRNRIMLSLLAADPLERRTAIPPPASLHGEPPW